jgi:hypothetical protein
MMVTKDDLRDKLYFRLVSIADELLSLQLMAVYIFEILGDGNNALYKLLSFSSKERFLDYLVHCDFVTSDRHLTAKALRRYLLGKYKVQYHQPMLQRERIHILVLCSSKGYYGSIQESIKWSRQANPTLSSNEDEWHKHIKDFENENTEASIPPATGPTAPENHPSKRRTTTPRPRLNNASSPPPDPIDMQCSTPILMRRRYQQGILQQPTRHPPTGIQKSFDKSFVDRLSAMKISGTSKPAKRVTIAPQQLFDCNKDSLSTLSETTRSTFPTSRSSQASSRSFPASTSIFVLTSSVNLGATQITECTIELINQDSYDWIKRKRHPPAGRELSDPIEHPTRGTLYFLVTEGFYVKLHHRMPTKKHPDVVDVVYAIPKRKIIVDKKSSTLKARKEKIGSAVEASLRAERFGYDDESRRVMGSLIAFLPKVSSLAWEQILPFTLLAYFRLAGVQAELEQLRLLMPKRNTIEALVADFAADSMMICVHSLQRAGIYYLSFDKVDASKGKMGGCVKIMSWFDETLTSNEYPDGQVLTLVLDADKTGGNSKDVADGVVYSIQKLGLSELVVGGGATTDSGGGGTIEGVVGPLIGAGVLILLALVANCTLHNLNLEMAVPLNKVLKGKNLEGVNKHDDRDVEQLVYAAFAWEHGVSKAIA